MTLKDLLAKVEITAAEIVAYGDGALAPARRDVVGDALGEYPALLEVLAIKTGITMKEIGDYADGTLSPDRREAVRAALAKYPDLLAVLAVKAGTTVEAIMAYADGVLALDRREVVREILAKHPDLMQLLESYTSTRGRIAEPFSNLPGAPPPDLVLGGGQATPHRPAPAKRFSFIAWLKGATGGQRVPNSPLPMVVVAALAIVVASGGLFLGYTFATAPSGYDFARFDERGFVASAALQQALERTLRDEQARLSPRLSIMPRSASRTIHGRLCREFDVIFDIGLKAGALACRGADDAWRIYGPAMPPGHAFQTVGKDTKSSLPPEPRQADPRDDGKEMIDLLKRRLGAGEPVSREEEKHLLDGLRKDKP